MLPVELIFEIVSHSRERVAPLRAHLVRNIFIATCKRNRLERDSLNLVDILRGKLYDLADSIVVDVVNNRDDQRDLDANASEVFDRSAALHQTSYRRRDVYSSLH